jgi:hypothetical protein
MTFRFDADVRIMAAAETTGGIEQSGAGRAGSGQDSASLVSIVLAIMLFTTLFLTRFALSFSRSELSLVLVVTLVCMAVLAGVGALYISPSRFILFAVAVSAMSIATMLGGTGAVSLLSLVNLVLLYACYIFVVPSERQFPQAIRLFRSFMLFIALAAILQFLAQFLIPGPTLFTFETFLPRAILSHGFNYVIAVPGLSSLNKANGFFLVEPSSLSQLTALAIIVELALFAPSWRLLVLGLALALSFSGTGLLLLAAIGPGLLLRKGWAGVLLMAIPVLLLAVFLAESLHFTLWFDRLGEFHSDQSSGFARFLSPFYLFRDYVFPRLDTTLFGLGPGSIEQFFNKTAYQIHDPTWGKLFFEYGVVGTLPFAIFVIYCFFVGARSAWLSGALFFTYLLLGGNLVDARLHTIILVLCILQNRPPDVSFRSASLSSRSRRAPRFADGAAASPRSPPL